MNYPKISIITPSYNQVEFLERTILSVLNQNYPNLEYIIIDGGSTDGSIEIIKKYENRITYWVSEKDLGQSNAINKGIKIATGDWIGWQNSDDVYTLNAFHDLSLCINKNIDKNLFIGNVTLIDSNDIFIRELNYVKPTYLSLIAEGMVLTNQAAFWKRDIHNQIGDLNENLHYAFDFEWFLRVAKIGKIEHFNSIWGSWRIQENAKASLYPKNFEHEFKIVRSNHKRLYPILRYLYILRRFILLLKMGNFKYILNSLPSRLKNFTN